MDDFQIHQHTIFNRKNNIIRFNKTFTKFYFQTYKKVLLMYHLLVTILAMKGAITEGAKIKISKKLV